MSASGIDLRDAFDVLSSEAKDLYSGNRVAELLELPTALEFARDHVGKNAPVVVRGCTLQWPGVRKWNSKYFRSLLAEKEVTVAVTPNGYADGLAIKDGTDYFVLPEEKSMPMSQFLDSLDSDGPVHYIQRQNSNFTGDFAELLDDIDGGALQFAREAFNKTPDAVNFWMGDQRAITWMHKDPYENMYCVISGYKDFILIPPVDMCFVPRKKYPTGTFKTASNGDMYIEPLLDDRNKIIQTEWVSVDPLNVDLDKYPDYERANIFEVRVNSGDILYLPSLWYHHVRQSHKCIAVNFWYDMEYDARYCYYRMMEKLCSSY